MATRAEPPAPTPKPLEIGAGVGVVVGSTGAAPAVEITARAWLADAIGLGLYGRPALATTSVEDPIGSADLHGVHAGASLLLALPWVPERALIVAPEIGVGVVDCEGRASSPYRGVHETDAGVALGLRVELRHAFHPSFAAGLALVGGAVVPPIEVRFDDEAKARWDAPFGAAIVNVALRLP